MSAWGCERSARSGPAQPAAQPAAQPPELRPPYAALRSRVDAVREELADRHGMAEGADARRLVLVEARRQLNGLLADVLLPAWYGTRWSFHGTTDEPLGPAGIACGYFVVTLLQHLGLRIESRRRFAQSPALTIARSLVPPGLSHHRVFSVPAATLEKNLVSFGEGVHLIGLDVHVGFVVVDRAPDPAQLRARMVHASYTGSRQVVAEPIAACEAIERSRAAGYHVTTLFAQDWLVDAWLSQRAIPLQTT